MVQNFSKLAKGKDSQVREIERVPDKMDPKRPTPRNNIIKMEKLNNKERSLKGIKKGN